MGKIYPVSTKYNVVADIEVDGNIDKNDIVGAIFGQTEGLLGEELELRELQKSGRIGRIEVDAKVKGSKTIGTITVPSSLSKTETAIIAAGLETIERIGPCDAKIKINNIEDVRSNKREVILKRAKNLLKQLNSDGADTQDIMNKVSRGVRGDRVTEYGPDKLTASNDLEESDEVILVEGRADVVNMLKYGFAGLLSINGVKVPKSIKRILDTKKCTLFVDGDRGGELIIDKVMKLGNLEYIAFAPDGKEVEELTDKEIHKCLRSKIKAKDYHNKKDFNHHRERVNTRARTEGTHERSSSGSDEFRNLMNDLFGTRGAYLLDDDKNIIGIVPVSELKNALKSSGKVSTLLLDGVVDDELVKIAEKKGVKNIYSNKVKASSKKIEIKEV